LLPAVPLEVHAQRTGQDDYSKSLPPETTLRPHTGLRGSNQTGALGRCANSGRVPVYAGPVLESDLLSQGGAGLSVRTLRTFGAGSLGQVGRSRSRDGLARFHIRNGIGLLPFRAPSRVSKRNKFRSPQVCRDAQRRTDKLGRHARCASFRASAPLCQVLFRDIPPRKTPEKRVQLPLPLEKSDDGSTLTPGPMVDEIATLLM
jgi:hypothetical protein